MMDLYENITRIGKGACGSVYLVRHKATKKLYALKKIQLDENRKTRTKEAVLREVKILAQLKHPNIVSYHDSFFEDEEEWLCIIQDYCDGGTLDDKICQAKQKKEHFSEKQIIQWFIQLSMAVHYMHSKKILHRDLKTQNVFMTKTGMTCKLGDFGISKKLDQTVDAAQTCVGTPCYLSPEMCQDIPYTSKADVWALGCILYEMCALRPAFEANNLISLFYKIVKAEYERIPKCYSDELYDVVKNILVKSPDDRPSARRVLSLPFIKEHLSNFIQEKAYILQLMQLKDSPHTTIEKPTRSKASSSSASKQCESQRSRSPTLSCHSIPSPVTPAALCDTDSGIQMSASTSSGAASTEDVRLQIRASIDKNQPSPVLNVTEEEYPDDFDDSSNSGDEIPEELPDGLIAEDGSESEMSDSANYDYPDDFEEYCCEDELDEVVSHARDIHRRNSSSEDEVVMDENSETPHLINTCKNLLEEHCIAALGRDQFEKVRKLGEKGKVDIDLRPTFERMAGTDHVETCYLVTEMLAEDG